MIWRADPNQASIRNMSDTAPRPFDAAAALDAPQALPPSELASLLASRLCHDFLSPASALSSGLSLLEDESDPAMRQTALELVGQSARKLTNLLTFSRVAFGGSSRAERYAPHDLETLARGVLASGKAQLEWTVTLPDVGKVAARTLLNLAQMGSAALPQGGTVRIAIQPAATALLVVMDARGPRVLVRPEVERGMAGGPQGDAVGGHWVQAYFLKSVLDGAGGLLRSERGENGWTVVAQTPA